MSTHYRVKHMLQLLLNAELLSLVSVV